MRKLTLFPLALIVLLAACDDPTSGKPKAQTGAAKPEAPAAAAAERLAFGPEKSTIGFVGSKVTGKHDGGFRAFAGTIDLLGGKPEASRVEVKIEMASVYSDAEKLTGHLQSADFFDVARFPQATFVLTAIVPDAAGYRVTGNLELHGVKKSIGFPATIAVAPAEVTVSAEFAINRKDFGIVYPGMKDDLIRDDVLLRLKIAAPRK